MAYWDTVTGISAWSAGQIVDPKLLFLQDLRDYAYGSKESQQEWAVIGNCGVAG